MLPLDTPVHQPLPDCAPRRGGAFTRWLARSALRLGGWRVRGEFPSEHRLMIIVAPHSSGWDAVWGLLVRIALGVDISFMAKAELFSGPIGWVLRRLGGFPVNRSSSAGVVEQVAERYRSRETLWVALAPEGTRRRVEHWKSGFWRIARAAEVPVLCVYFHYPEKVIGIGPLLRMTDSLDDDMARIREYYRPWIGKNRGTV
ncbi:lysophospholipid acyltransferase family protein [Aquimonas voraii]|uniref:1-acyl-sn-glycerol-3-phosphate acyltransferases n=1 Tax=Aquimonas voraii TaxID=265719 RepID=A0A1G6WM53_9GAMM|nr:lysophospholipid acyltransferase family protein [Aquimonas voraii]SDD66891.1 1-acyl-sn-glycerol-3-phosphate acyltransferases [Aquimonas voraii]